MSCSISRSSLVGFGAARGIVDQAVKVGDNGRCAGGSVRHKRFRQIDDGHRRFDRLLRALAEVPIDDQPLLDEPVLNGQVRNQQIDGFVQCLGRRLVKDGKPGIGDGLVDFQGQRSEFRLVFGARRFIPGGCQRGRGGDQPGARIGNASGRRDSRHRFGTQPHLRLGNFPKNEPAGDAGGK
jgi:hypothetical protein